MTAGDAWLVTKKVPPERAAGLAEHLRSPTLYRRNSEAEAVALVESIRRQAPGLIVTMERIGTVDGPDPSRRSLTEAAVAVLDALPENVAGFSQCAEVIVWQSVSTGRWVARAIFPDRTMERCEGATPEQAKAALRERLVAMAEPSGDGR